jgi:hypothetical protein
VKTAEVFTASFSLKVRDSASLLSDRPYGFRRAL